VPSVPSTSGSASSFAAVVCLVAIAVASISASATLIFAAINALYYGFERFSGGHAERTESSVPNLCRPRPRSRDRRGCASANGWRLLPTDAATCRRCTPWSKWCRKSLCSIRVRSTRYQSPSVGTPSRRSHSERIPDDSARELQIGTMAVRDRGCSAVRARRMTAQPPPVSGMPCWSAVSIGHPTVSRRTHRPEGQ